MTGVATSIFLQLRRVILGAALFLCLSGLRAEGDRADSASVLELDAGLGFSDHQREVKADQWYPLRVSVKAVRADVQGEVTLGQTDNPLRLVIPVDVAKGTKKQYEMPFRPANGANAQSPIKVELETRRLGSEDLTLQLQFLQRGDRQVLVVADDPIGFAFLSVRYRLDSPAQGYLPEQSLVYGTPDQLPDNTLLYEPLNMIIFSTSALRRIHPAQWEAMMEWVYHGGRLLIAVGRHQPFYSESSLPKVTGLNFSQPVAMDFSTTGTEPLSVARSPAEFDPLAADRVWLAEKGEPVIFGFRRGRGWLNFSLVALDEPFLQALESRAGPARMWARLVSDGPSTSAVRTITDLNEGGIGLMQQIPFFSNLAGVGWVIQFAGLYLLLAVPVNWLVWSRFKRREAAWPTALLLAAVFTWYAYSTGASSAIPDARISTFTAVSKPAGSARAREISLNSIYTPRRTSATFPIGETGLPSPVAGYNMGYYASASGPESPYSTQGFKLAGPRPLELQDFVVYPSSARGLRLDSLRETTGSLVVVQPIEPDPDRAGRLRGVVRNATGHGFDEWYLVRGFEVFRGTEPLADGGEVGLADSLTTSAQDLTVALYNSAATLIGTHPSLRGSGYASLSYFIDNIQNQWLNLTPRIGSPGNEVRFIGIEKKSTGRPIPGIKAEEGSRYLWYEEDLPVIGGTVETAATGGRWRFAYADDISAMNNANSYMWAMTQMPSVSGKTTDSLIIQPQEIIVRVEPEEQIDPTSIASLDLQFEMDPFPLSQGSMVDGKKRYRVAGCPVAVFDASTDRWKDMGGYSGGVLHLESAENFLESGRILMKLDATPTFLLYAELDDQEKPVKIVPPPESWKNWYPQNVLQIGAVQVRLNPKPEKEETRP